MSAPKPPLAEALAELHAIVDGDDIDPAATLAELREPSGHLLAGVEDLRAQVAALTAERDQARAELATEHYRAQRELLLCLWREMEGDQEGDAPANHLLESGLISGSIRRDEHIAVLESEVQTVSDERDRLARVLACEVGDAEHASDGWQRDVHHRWSRRSPGFYLVAFKWGGTHTWEVWDNPDGTLICHGRAKYALDAMLAADEAARAGEAS